MKWITKTLELCTKFGCKNLDLEFVYAASTIAIVAGAQGNRLSCELDLDLETQFTVPGQLIMIDFFLFV